MNNSISNLSLSSLSAAEISFPLQKETIKDTSMTSKKILANLDKAEQVVVQMIAIIKSREMTIEQIIRQTENTNKLAEKPSLEIRKDDIVDLLASFHQIKEDIRNDINDKG